MEIKIGSLLAALDKVRPGLASNELIEQSIHFIFGENFVRTYNDEIAVTQKAEMGIVGAVKADEFYKLITKLPGEKVNIEQDEKSVIINYETGQAEIAFADEIMLPDVSTPGINSKKWKVLPEGFAEAVAFCRFSVSNSMILPALVCLWVNDNRVVSCDNYRATYKEMEDEIPEPFLLPAKPAQFLPNYNPTKYMIEGGWLHFINRESTVFSCRSLDAEYPEAVWDFFNVKGKKVTMPDKFSKVVDRVQTLATQDVDIDRFVTLTMQKGNLNCKSKGDIGRVNEDVKIDFKGEKIQVNVHPELLMEILKHIKDMTIGEKLLFEGEGFQHSILLSD
jgi:DNA polymerase III sliding clamp (beta) subunit (PCNA family)